VGYGSEDSKAHFVVDFRVASSESVVVVLVFVFLL
jgi:hypothetical protein